MMEKLRYESDAELGKIQELRVAVLGYGSQGHAHALNLRDSGVEVRVGLRKDSASWAKAIQSGLSPMTVAQAVQWADLVSVLVPDAAQPAVYEQQIKPWLREGQTLLFAHGFNVHYKNIEPSASVNVVLIAPKSPGHRVRETFVDGGGVPALLAVHADATGDADAVALAYACAIGCGRAGVLLTTFAEETETDLFGEQAVLCGGVSELVKAGFETLVDAGYQPEVAYFECLHELKLIVDLMYRGGLNYMRYSISDTAEFGDYQSGTRIINENVRSEMQAVLKDIQSGHFARNWMNEVHQGSKTFLSTRSKEQEHLLEKVGAKVRKAMPFVQPVDWEGFHGTSQ
jgi:ketol-acid reductoisomerase